MKINNNISAVITNKQLLGTEDSMAASMERLSSGIKLNHAKDSPSGISISGRMKAQIRGLSRASDNSADANNVLNVADGALTEVTSMLQRMNELAVQAANGTNAKNDRQTIQEEMNQLRNEIDRVSSTTQFNSKNLLDGSLDARVYPDQTNINNVSRLSVSENVAAGNYELTVNSAAQQATTTIAGVTPASLVGQEGKLYINGSELEITADMTQDEIYTALREAAEYGGCNLVGGLSDTIEFKSNAFGVHAEITLLQDSDSGIFGSVPNKTTGGTASAVYGSDANVSLNTTPPGSSFGSQSSIKYDGNHITITDSQGFEMSMMLRGDETDYTTSPVTITIGFTGTIKFEVTDIGIMDVQVGANEGQMLSLRIPEISSESLYLDDINVATTNGSLHAIDRIKDALSKLSEVRSAIGATQNRLDYTIDSLDTTEENVTAAMSRLEDTDMAEEMVEYTKLNVLQQAGTSVLSQANELPSLALQLLQ